jgi:hypothetical protein
VSYNTAHGDVREALATWIAVCDCQLSTSILHVCLNVIAMILCSA